MAQRPALRVRRKVPGVEDAEDEAREVGPELGRVAHPSAVQRLHRRVGGHRGEGQPAGRQSPRVGVRRRTRLVSQVKRGRGPG